MRVHDTHWVETFRGGFEKSRWPLYEQPLNVGMQCANPNCIVHDPMEGPYVRNKFHVVSLSDGVLARCMYCENDNEHFVVANRKAKWFSADTSLLSKVSTQKLKDFVFFLLYWRGSAGEKGNEA